MTAAPLKRGDICVRTNNQYGSEESPVILILRVCWDPTPREAASGATHMVVCLRDGVIKRYYGDIAHWKNFEVIR